MPSFFYLFSAAQEAVHSISTTTDSASRTIHLSSKALAKDNKILLQWEAVNKIDFYIVERSIDEKQFEVIGVIKAKPSENNFDFTDERPLKKAHLYRIKMQDKNESTLYSETITAGIADSLFCRFYPNPVDKLLMLRSDYSAELKITDIMGNTRIIQTLKPGLQILDLSFLEKSTYVITIFRQDANQFITQKLVKN